MSKLQDRVIAVQQSLKAPKSQYNSFGKYSYRNQEDILEAVKPLLAANGLVLTISDSVEELVGVVVITATATLSDGTDSTSVTAQAGVDLNRKGMDIAQSFGASSSYARKYALNGLFLIDDTKDADSSNTHGKGSTPASTPAPKAAPAATAAPAPVTDEDTFSKAIDYVKGSKNSAQAVEMVLSKYGASFSEKQVAAIKKFA
jgi:hypothetical protein